MKNKFAALLIGLLTLAAQPTTAAPSQAHQNATWRSQLQQAMCSQSWSRAIGVSGALMGSDIQPNERIWLLALRQDLFAYQAGTASFAGCENGMMAGATAESVQLLSAESAADWQGTLVRLGFAESTAPVAIAAAFSPATRTAAPLPSTETTVSSSRLAETACQVFSTRGFRVASGTTSSRWVYEIWQDVDTFYAQYWRQSQTCADATSSGGFETQEAALEYVLSLRSNESVGNIP
ncbi:MAG: hypothetical protein HY785_07830 [Oscillatoriophycideae cyanobacterium NC_groundwater_1537_Pr4_S-0.65um_50_18]|nr:hypothetical protein [Oscillatoriophycideae cyanobacterium NC_groundwater_1537_Pr4_S-0.65um_50_18]